MNENRLFLPEGSLTLLAERAEIGQRALAVTIAQKLQKQYPQREVLYFSLEMARQYMYCCHRIPSNSKLCVIDHLFYLEDIYSTAQLMQKCGRLGLIVVDYLQMLDTVDTSLQLSDYDTFEENLQKRWQISSHCLTSLKSMAQELKVPVLVLAHLSYNINQRDDKRPVIRDLRDAKITEQDADQIWLLHRDSYYDSEADKRKSELIIAKNRYGDRETIQISYERNGIYNWFSGFTVSYDDILEEGGTDNGN